MVKYRIGLYLLSFLAMLYLVTPFLWVVLVSFMEEREANQHHWNPRQPTFDNYWPYLSKGSVTAEDKTVGDAVGGFTARQFPRAIINSLLNASLVMAMNLFFGSLAAYALARVAIMVPMYLLIRGYGLLDTHLAIILAHTTFTLPFTIWILKGYFQTIPIDLERSARIDGCTRLGALFRVFMPVATPGMIAVGVFAFISSWGEFFFALLLTSSIGSKPVTVLISDFAQELQVDFTLIAAGGVLVVLIPIVLAFIFQRFIIHGIGGAVTG